MLNLYLLPLVAREFPGRPYRGTPSFSLVEGLSKHAKALHGNLWRELRPQRSAASLEMA